MYVQDNNQQFMPEWQNYHHDHCWAWWPCQFGTFYGSTPRGVFGWYTAPQTSPTEYGLNWAYVLIPFIKQSNVKKISIMTDPAAAPSYWNPATDTDSSSYAYVSFLGDQGVRSGAPARFESIPDPAQQILFWDTGKDCRVVEVQGLNGFPWNPRCKPYEPPPDLEKAFICPMCYPNWLPPHMGGRNYVFADGHANYSNSDRRMSVAMHPGYWNWECQK